MNSWQQILAAYPALQTVWDILIIVLPLAAILGYSGLLFLASTAKILACSRKRSSFDKCSRQLAFLALILGWILLVGSRIWLYQEQPGRDPEGVENFFLEVSWLLFSIGVFLSSIFYTLWKVLRKLPVLHATVGMISAVLNCFALFVIIFTIRICATGTASEYSGLSLPSLLPTSWNDPIYSTLCYTLPLLLAMPGAWGACWLLLRRNKDDFGRDYYNGMVSWCCGWARNGWTCLWLLLVTAVGLQIWQLMQEPIFNAEDALLANAGVLLWLLPALLWTAVRRGRPPLRRSYMLGVALLIACLFMLPYFLEMTRI